MLSFSFYRQLGQSIDSALFPPYCSMSAFQNDHKNILFDVQNLLTPERKADFAVKTLDWDLGDLGSIHGSTTGFLCEYQQVIYSLSTHL